MTNQITSDDVSSQFAIAIKLLLEWARQEFQNRNTTTSDKVTAPQQFINTDKLLKASEVAKILQISRSMVYRMISRNEIPTIHIGKTVRVRRVDLDEFINRRE